MRRHSGSRQKPVPKSTSTPGSTAGPDNFNFTFTFTFNSVIGRTVMLKSGSWATAERDRHEYTIKIGMILSEVIRHHRVCSDALHTRFQKLSINTKALAGLQ